MVDPAALSRATTRVQELAEDYVPPTFAEVPTPDAALFLAAIDHRTGFEGAHEVDGEGPFEGSALLWALGLRAERERPGTLSAAGVLSPDAKPPSEIFTVAGQVVAGPEMREELWRDAARVLADGYGGSAQGLIDAAGGKLGGPGGLLERLAAIDPYSDPLAKKSFLVAKIWERRGWLEVADPEAWQVCADNVLMRLALRSGLVEPSNDVDAVRAATRRALRELADESGISPPVLDDLLWERGRDDADLLGSEAGDLSEPPRPAGTIYW